MRAKTWEAVHAYREYFGEDPCDLRTVRNSGESKLIAQIEAAIESGIPVGGEE